MTGSSLYTGIGYEIDKDAAWDYIRDGYLFAPRTVLNGRIKHPHLVALPNEFDLKNISVHVQQALEASMGKMSGERRVIMFSGGFDSILMALLSQRAGAEVTTVTVQFDDFNPSTVQESIECARRLNLPHHVLPVKTTEFVTAFELLAGLTDEPILDLELGIVYVALEKYRKQIAKDVFISGMGSDQWFGDMALEDWPGGFEGRLDWAIINAEAHHQVARVHGHKFVFPFLSKSMLSLSQVTPDGLKENKKMLRALAIVNSIPHRGARTEIQMPEVVRRLLVKIYGHRAWPGPITDFDDNGIVPRQVLRQIVLGLWLEKVKERRQIYEQSFLYTKR